jgi:hypothetical protein
LEGLIGLKAAFSQQERAQTRPDLWPAVEKQIGTASSRRDGWTFALVATLLVGYKLVEWVPENAPGVAIRIVPFAIVLALFILIRENPFKINAELMMEK